jgi:hypothetical protein
LSPDPAPHLSISVSIFAEIAAGPESIPPPAGEGGRPPPEPKDPPGVIGLRRRVGSRIRLQEVVFRVVGIGFIGLRRRVGSRIRLQDVVLLHSRLALEPSTCPSTSTAIERETSRSEAHERMDYLCDKAPRHLSPVDLDCAGIVCQLGSHAPDVLLEREDLLLVASLVADEVLAGAAGGFGL